MESPKPRKPLTRFQITLWMLTWSHAARDRAATEAYLTELLTMLVARAPASASIVG